VKSFILASRRHLFEPLPGYSHLAPQHQLAAVQRLCDTGALLNAATSTKTDTESHDVLEGKEANIQ
jgi:hypothetical protein